jgi:hypothetical protein
VSELSASPKSRKCWTLTFDNGNRWAVAAVGLVEPAVLKEGCYAAGGVMFASHCNAP